MKTSQASTRLHWPRAGVAVRVPPRRLAGVGARCELIVFSGGKAEPARTHPWERFADGLPRGMPVVLLVAAEDVSFTDADVPALSGMRLREALPNLVEEQTVGEIGTLHVALGQSAAEGRGRTLAVIDRVWLAAMQVHVVRSGHRVAAIVPESLAVPLLPGAWSLACVTSETGDGMRCWLRTETQQAMLLPADADSAVSVAAALMRQGSETIRPTQLALYAAPAVLADATRFGATLATSLALTPSGPAAGTASDPFAAWLAGQGPEGGYGAPLSLLSYEGSGNSAWPQWRWAAFVAVAIVAVQIVGMQWEWGRLRGEAGALRQQASAVLVAAFPETRVVLDAPLQMSRGLAGLRATAGHSDPADFSTMMAASARIFAALPSNALRAADYDTRALRLRFAPGTATASDERERLVAAALQEGYQLRFDAAANAVGEASASLKTKGGA
ncbi:MAG: type II secretion system protein GspL [Burkholderiaceae bacterium]